MSVLLVPGQIVQLLWNVPQSKASKAHMRNVYRIGTSSGFGRHEVKKKKENDTMGKKLRIVWDDPRSSI